MRAEGRQQNDPKSNREVLHQLILQLGQSVVSDARIPDTAAVSVFIPASDATDDSAIVRGALLQSIRESGRKAFLRVDSLPPKEYLLSVGASRTSVHYHDMFRDGFLGSKKVLRSISARLTCEIVNAASKEVLYSNTPSRAWIDTIMVDDISRLERGAPASGRAELPQEGFFDRAIEPFVIIGATGIAVFLFFHVRS